MNHETLEQAARDWIDKNYDFSMMHTIIEDITKGDYAKCFKAGASWREQQMAEQFKQEGGSRAEVSVGEEWWIRATGERVHLEVDTRVINAIKLLADKDAEIERLKKKVEIYFQSNEDLDDDCYDRRF